MRLRALFALCALFAAPLQAAPATERYAPVQLEVARAALDRAEQMLRQGRGEAARRLAAQASLDARLAWAMTDSPFLRTEAAALHERSARLDFNALSMMKEAP
jgi:hypothetical protein